MKIRTFDRILLTVASLFMIAEAAVVGLLALGYGRTEFDFWVDVLLYHPVNRVLLCIVAVLLLVIALRLLFLRVGKRSSAPETIFMLSTEAGSIRITVAAIEAIVQRASRGNAQVRDVKVRVISQDNQLKAALRVMLTPDANVKDVSCALQASIKAALEDNTGIPVPEVQVTVEATPAAQPSRVE